MDIIKGDNKNKKSIFPNNILRSVDLYFTYPFTIEAVKPEIKNTLKILLIEPNVPNIP